MHVPARNRRDSCKHARDPRDYRPPGSQPGDGNQQPQRGVPADVHLAKQPGWHSVRWRAIGAATVASAALLLPARSTGDTGAMDARVPCSAAQYASSTPPPGYRSVLGAVGLPGATSKSGPSKYVLGGGTTFQRRFPYAVFLTLLVNAGSTPITLTVPDKWTGRELVTTDLQRTSASSLALASIRFDACPGLAAIHPHLAYSFTILIWRSGCYPLIVQAGTHRARISLNLSIKQTRNCRQS